MFAEHHGVLSLPAFTTGLEASNPTKVHWSPGQGWAPPEPAGPQPPPPAHTSLPRARSTHSFSNKHLCLDISQDTQLMYPTSLSSSTLKPGCLPLFQISVNGRASTHLDRAEHVILNSWLASAHTSNTTGRVQPTSFLSLESCHIPPCPLFHPL